MTTAPLTIRNVTARAVVSPISRPVRTAVGAILAAPLVLLDVTTEEGVTGHSYLFGYTPTALPPLVKLVEQLAIDLKGKKVVPSERMREFDSRFRLLGMRGLIGMVVSGLDMAFWDILGKAADLPVVQLIGGVPTPLQTYDSYGVVDIRTDEMAIFRSLERGFEGIKIKGGFSTLAHDIEAVRWVRSIVGSEIALMMDYNQSLGPAEACHRIEHLKDFDLLWVEEPVSAQDLLGHARVKKSSRIPIQTGENWWFPRGMQHAITAGACDFAMPDIMKMGGVTGWVAAAALADAASMPAHVEPYFHRGQCLCAGGYADMPLA